jgi:hypothetical protein
LHDILSGTSSIYTTTGTIFNRLDTQAGTSNPLVNAADNLFYIRQVATPAGTLWSFYGNAGDTITRPVVINDEGPAQVNEHQMMPVDVINQAGTWKTVDEVFERIGPVGTTPGRDITHPSGGPGNVTAAFIHRMEGLVVLPDCTGRAPGAYRGRGDTNTKMQIVHSTIPTDMTPVANSDFYGAVTIGSEYAGLAGMLDENQSNLFYASAGFPGLFANAGFGTAYTTAHTVPSGANVADVMNVAKYGHNAHFNGKNGTVYDAAGANGLTVLGLHGLWLSVRNIVAGKWSTDVDLGTGADLQAAGPKFVDPTRCIATFDTAYLGNTAPAWAPTTVYAFGDIRSCSSAAFYGGVTVNFRCIKGHTSASSATADPYTGQPGNSTTNIATIPGGGTRGGFREYWELAGVYRIRAAQKAGALTTDATLGLTAVPLQRAYHAWVRAGRAPQAAALNLAAHDGTTIGAMAYVAPLIVSAFTLPLVLAHKIAAKFGKTFSSLFNY